MVSTQLPKLEEFLRDYPGMMVSPATERAFMLKGEFEFSVKESEHPSITDSYALEIMVPDGFPKVVPLVKEIGRKIPRDGKHHVNPPPDNTLCLGSPLRLRWKLMNTPTLVGFAKACLVPYLYSVSYKLKYGVFPWGELAHGEPGVIHDYLDLFDLRSSEQVLYVLELLGKKKRLANKKQCPCGCGKRLGACPYHFKMLKFRELASRSWYRQHLVNIGSGK